MMEQSGQGKYWRWTTHIDDGVERKANAPLTPLFEGIKELFRKEMPIQQSCKSFIRVSTKDMSFQR